MGLVKDCIGPTLYPVLEGWTCAQEDKLLDRHVFRWYEDLAWFDQAHEGIVDASMKGCYSVAFVVYELAGTIFGVVGSVYEFVAEGFYNRSFEAVLIKGEELLYRNLDNLQSLAYTVAKFVLILTGDQNFARLIKHQEDERFTKHINEGYFADVTPNNTTCNQQRSELRGMSREELITNAMACCRIKGAMIGVGSFLPSKPSQRHSLRLLSANLDTAQQSALGELAKGTNRDIPTLRDEACSQELLDQCKQTLLAGHFSHIQIDQRSVWVLVDLVQDPQAKKLLQRVKVFEVIDCDWASDQDRDRFLAALNLLHTKLGVSRHPLDGLFLLSKVPGGGLPPICSSVERRVFVCADHSWSSPTLTEAAKVQLQAVLSESMSEAVLPPDDNLTTRQDRADRKIKPLTARDIAHHVFRPVTTKEKSRALFGENILPTDIYRWVPAKNLSLLHLTGPWGLRFDSSADFEDFVGACRALPADHPRLTLTDIIFNYPQEAAPLAPVLDKLSLEKVHFYTGDEVTDLIEGFDGLGLYSFAIRKDEIVVLSELPAKDYTELVHSLANTTDIKVPYHSVECMAKIPLDEITEIIGGPHRARMPYNIDFIMEGLGDGNLTIDNSLTMITLSDQLQQIADRETDKQLKALLSNAGYSHQALHLALSKLCERKAKVFWAQIKKDYPRVFEACDLMRSFGTLYIDSAVLQDQLVSVAEHIGTARQKACLRAAQESDVAYKAAMETLFNIWSKAPSSIPKDEYSEIAKLERHQYYVKLYGALDASGNLSVEQVLTLLRGNSGFTNKARLMLDLASHPDFADEERFPNFESRLAHTLCTWGFDYDAASNAAFAKQKEALDPQDGYIYRQRLAELERLEQESAQILMELKLLQLQVAKFNVRRARKQVDVEQALSPKALRALKRCDMPLALPSGYVLTEPLISAINSAGLKQLFITVTDDTLGHNLRALEGIDHAMDIRIIPDPRYKKAFTYWQSLLNIGSTYAKKDAQALQGVVQAIKNKGSSLSCHIPLPLTKQAKAVTQDSSLSVIHEGDDESRLSSRQSSRATSFDEETLSDELNTPSLDVVPEDDHPEVPGEERLAVEHIDLLWHALRLQPVTERTKCQAPKMKDVRYALRDLGLNLVRA